MQNWMMMQQMQGSPYSVSRNPYSYQMQSGTAQCSTRRKHEKNHGFLYIFFRGGGVVENEDASNKAR